MKQQAPHFYSWSASSPATNLTDLKGARWNNVGISNVGTGGLKVRGQARNHPSQLVQRALLFSFVPHPIVPGPKVHLLRKLNPLTKTTINCGVTDVNKKGNCTSFWNNIIEAHIKGSWHFGQVVQPFVHQWSYKRKRDIMQEEPKQGE